MQPEHLYLLFGILGNLSKILFIKLPASDEKEAAKSDLFSTFAFYSPKCYFNQDSTQNKLLDFVHGEKPQQVTDMLLEVILKNKLNKENMIGFCADNAPVNFRGVTRSEGENVLPS